VIKEMAMSLRTHAAAALIALIVLVPLQAQGPREGIRVRGDWVLQVVNPDGSLAETRAFRNALVGATTLGEALNGRTTIGRWRVTLSSPGDASPWTFSQTHLDEARSPSGQFKTLTVTCCNELRLEGSATATKAGSISSVATQVFACDDHVSIADCRNPPPQGVNAIFKHFTFTELAQPLALQKDQMLRVTVTISFGSDPH
jgi:hypothetical protein